MYLWSPRFVFHITEVSVAGFVAPSAGNNNISLLQQIVLTATT